MIKSMELTVEKNSLYWKVLQFRVQEEKIEKLFNEFRKNNIEPILIKGWAASRFYPKPFERIASDIDIAIDPDDFEKGTELLKKMSISAVDLHCGLRHLDAISWKDLFERSELVTLNESKIRVLCAEDHLRVLCVHWLNDGGVSKQRLSDVYYILSNPLAEFDWDKCLNGVEEIRRNWILTVVALTVRHLNLDLNNSTISHLLLKPPNWLVKCIEKEWKSDVRIKPLHHCLGSSDEFIKQIKKRFPPNPIQATIELKGRFDNKPRIFYQMGSLILRIKPSLERIFQTVYNQKKQEKVFIADQKQTK